MHRLLVRSLAVLSAGLLLGPIAGAQVPAHNAEKFASVYAQVVEIFGGQAAFQTAYEEARAEQARVETALQLSLNLEARFRANNAVKSADIYLNAANGLRTTVENLRVTFTKLEALNTPLDETRAKAAYDRVIAEHAAIFQKPLTEQFDYSKAHKLSEEPLRAVQTAANTLIAVAEKKPG